MQLDSVAALSNRKGGPGCSSMLFKKYENNLIKKPQQNYLHPYILLETAIWPMLTVSMGTRELLACQGSLSPLGLPGHRHTAIPVQPTLFPKLAGLEDMSSQTVETKLINCKKSKWILYEEPRVSKYSGGRTWWLLTKSIQVQQGLLRPGPAPDSESSKSIISNLVFQYLEHHSYLFILNNTEPTAWQNVYY